MKKSMICFCPGLWAEDRYEPFATMVNHAKTLIGIDHHISNDGFGDFLQD